MTNEQRIQIQGFKLKGFKFARGFVGEYILMIDEDLNKVRIYEDGRIWATDPKTGAYIKEVT